MTRIKRIYDVYTFNKGNMCNTNNMDSKLHHKMGLNERINELGSHNNTHTHAHKYQLNNYMDMEEEKGNKISL